MYSHLNSSLKGEPLEIISPYFWLKLWCNFWSIALAPWFICFKGLSQKVRGCSRSRMIKGASITSWSHRDLFFVFVRIKFVLLPFCCFYYLIWSLIEVADDAQRETPSLKEWNLTTWIGKMKRSTILDEIKKKMKLSQINWADKEMNNTWFEIKR